MALFDVKEKLYKKDGDKDLAKYDQVSFDVRKSAINPAEAGFKKTDDAWEEAIDETKETRKKAVKIGGIVFASVLVIAVLLVGFYFFKKTSFSVDKVSIQINGNSEAASGEKLSYEIVIENKNRAMLKSATLKINYPESFVPEGNPNFKQEGMLGGTFDLGDIEGKNEKKVVLNGKVYSPKGTIIYLKTNLLFYPAGFSGRFESNNQRGLSIISSPISLSLLAPQNMASGNSIDYLITYKNEGKEDYDNIKIKMEYPAGFLFSKSEPMTSEGENIWYIGRLSSGQEGKIIISGKLEGENNNIKIAKVYVGEINDGQFIAQNEERVETEINSSPLVISQIVNGVKNLSINVGEPLHFQINYKNEGTISLRDVIVTEKIDSIILDYEKLKNINDGTVDMKNKTITWKASNVPGLKNLNPGDSGTIDFEIPVKDIIPINGTQDKNFIVSSLASIDSPDVQTPIGENKIVSGNRMDIKLNSKVFLNVKGLYYDAFTSNSGPLPLKVGQGTTYIIKWTLNNVSNDVANAKVEATLPPGVSFTGKIYPENSNLTFNERTNNIVWDIGNLSSGTGILTAPKEISFQVKIIPAPHQKGTYADILDQAVITGKDLFTNNELSFVADKKTTYLAEDKKIEENEYKVE